MANRDGADPARTSAEAPALIEGADVLHVLPDPWRAAAVLVHGITGERCQLPAGKWFVMEAEVGAFLGGEGGSLWVADLLRQTAWRAADGQVYIETDDGAIWLEAAYKQHMFMSMSFDTGSSGFEAQCCVFTYCVDGAFKFWDLRIFQETHGLKVSPYMCASGIL